MPDRQRPRSFRPTLLRSLAPLSSVAVLAVGLGLAGTVWGGPPADPPEPDAAPVAEDGLSTPDSDRLSGDPTASAPVDPADDAAIAEQTDGAALPLGTDESAASVPAASSLRAKMEEGMGHLGELAVEARNDEDLVRATCVLDKQDRANNVMDLGTSELLVIRDPGTSEQARGFALEKLDAAALRIDALVQEAKACSGREGPEEKVDITRNDANEPSEIPILDPSLGLGANPVPPPMDGGWPPAASAIE